MLIYSMCQANCPNKSKFKLSKRNKDENIGFVVKHFHLMVAQPVLGPQGQVLQEVVPEC